MAYALTGVAAIMWATNGIFTDIARDEGAETRQIIVFASVFALLILLPMIALTDPKSLRVKKQDLLPLLIFSIVTGTFFSFAWYYCLERTSVTVAVILLYAYPSMVTVASVFVLKERLNREKAFALPLTF